MTRLNVKAEEFKKSFFKNFLNIRAFRRILKHFMLKKIRQKIESLSAKVLINDKHEALKDYIKRMFNALKEMHNELFNKLNNLKRSIYQINVNSIVNISKLNIKLSDMKALMR